jgi:redox-sensitive bicupin YhaK (pirin superfamily)
VQVEVRRAQTRPVTRTAWLESRHSFSFGPHYDPANTSFGVLVASNDDLVRPNGGFDPHPHRDLEIVTWALAGGLVHTDSLGSTGVATPGVPQWLGAGSGVVHSERAAGGEPARYVQMWVVPDEQGLPPAYARADVSRDLAGGELVPVASGRRRRGGAAALPLRQAHAVLHAARPAPGGTVRLPGAALVHLYVAVGDVHLEGVGRLGEGDAARIVDGDGQRVVAAGAAEVLVWEMDGRVGR